MATLGPAVFRFEVMVITIWLSLVLNSSASAQTCANTIIPGDRDIWSGASYMTENWYRDNFASTYGLYKGDWDQGWGWSKHNDPDPHQWEFPKMMSAGRLLWSGIDDTPGTAARLSQGAWAVRVTTEGADTVAQPYPAMRAVSRTLNEVDLMYADSAAKLKHVLYSGSPWNPGTFPPATASVSVSDLLAGPKNDLRISSPPEVGTSSSDHLEVVARQSVGLLHFRWSRASGWFSALDATSLTRRPSPVNGTDRYLIFSDPVVLRWDDTWFDVFALDNFRHLIHYRWEGIGWFAEDVTHKLQDGFHMTGDPVPVRRPDGTVDVFGRSVLGRSLIHYELDRNGDAWSSEELTIATAGLATNEIIDSQPAVVSLGNAVLVYYRVGYKLFLLVHESSLWVRLQIARDYAIVSDPVVVRRTSHAAHGFARDIVGGLIHFYFTPELGIGSERLWPTGIDDSPTVVVTNQKRLDLFARNGAHQLVHLYWTNTGGWRNENINLTNGVSPTYDTVGVGGAAVVRAASALEVFAERFEFPNVTVHFASAFGPSVSSWHTNEEYWQWAAGPLHAFKYTPAFTSTALGTPFANANRGWWFWDRVQMQCPSFIVPPAWRAAVMLHESTHMIFWPFDHQTNPRSDCNTPCSDNWFFHGARDPAGSLTELGRNHSMVQIEIEYLTDVEEFPAWWVPSSAYRDAIWRANSFMTHRILNPPGWTPGTPRPLK